MITDTSMIAYEQITSKLSSRQRKVFNSIKALGKTCNEAIAWHTELPINCVCPRVLELRKMGLIVEAGVNIKGPHGRPVRMWRVSQLKNNLFS